MKNLTENNLIRFTNISKRKDSIYANFKVRGIRNGTIFSASISVDIAALELTIGDPLEKIIHDCLDHGVREFKKANFQFEDPAVKSEEFLGVAQLG